MITHRVGDLFESDAVALVNPVNCVGVSGAGLALEFKSRFSVAQADYEAVCRAGDLHLGHVLVSSTGRGRAPGWVVHFPTKGHWRQPSRLEDIEEGLWSLRNVTQIYGWPSIAIPALGCGRGGLDWADVLPAIEYVFRNENRLRIDLYGPHDHS